MYPEKQVKMNCYISPIRRIPRRTRFSTAYLLGRRQISTAATDLHYTAKAAEGTLLPVVQYRYRSLCGPFPSSSIEIRVPPAAVFELGERKISDGSNTDRVDFERILALQFKTMDRCL